MASRFLCSPASVEIRQLVGCTPIPAGSRPPVPMPRFLPAELAHQLARKLAAGRFGTVPVF